MTTTSKVLATFFIIVVAALALALVWINPRPPTQPMPSAGVALELELPDRSTVWRVDDPEKGISCYVRGQGAIACVSTMASTFIAPGAASLRVEQWPGGGGGSDKPVMGGGGGSGPDEFVCYFGKKGEEKCERVRRLGGGTCGNPPCR